MEKEISRRDFMKGAAAGAVGIAAVGVLSACTPEASTSAAAESSSSAPQTTTPDAGTAQTATGPAWLGAEPEIAAGDIKQTIDTDVIVVGCGTGGWGAVMTLAELGVPHVVVDRAENPGAPKGDLGSIGSRLQLEAIAQNPELAIDKNELLKDLVRYSSGFCDARLWNQWAEHSGEAMDWYTDILADAGIPMWLEAGIGTPGGRDKAYATGHSPEGGNVVEALQAYTESFGQTTWQLGSSLVKCIKEGDRVTGVIVEDASLDYVQINASRGVILATGGYSANSAMVNGTQPYINKLQSRLGGSSNGAGIKAAMWAGATLQEVPCSLLFNRTAIKPNEVSGPDAEGKNFWYGEQPFLKVNLRGERFCNESGPYDFLSHSTLYQPGAAHCVIWDATYAEDIARFEMVGCSRLGEFPNGAPSNWTLERAVESWETLIDEGYVIKADTLEELAEGLNIPVDTFLENVERYNRFYDNGYDEDFGKVAYRLSRVDQAPFYGVRTSTWFLCTLDGVHIDTSMHALDENKEPIEGMYVIGNDSGGYFANTYPNLATGIAAGRTLTCGRLVAQSLAAR